MNNELLSRLEEHAFYESGLSADGCYEKLDDYAKQAITKYGRILLEQQLKDLKEGFKGCCYCCEPVGELNQALEKENEKLKEMLDMQTKLVVDLEMRSFKIEEQS